MNYKIYTDGACSGNPGPGGWGIAVIKDDKCIHSNFNNEQSTTNNRMELAGFLSALDWCYKNLTNNDTVEIYTDSAYIYNCFKDKWYTKWMSNNWLNASKQPIANKDLWQPVLQRYFDIMQNQITINKVAGHTGNKWNEYVDRLAVLARKELNK